MKTPRSKWLTNQAGVNRLASILDQNPELPGLLHEAFTQYVWELPDATDASTGALAKARVDGAKGVITTFLGMADQIPVKTKPATGLRPPTTE